MYTNWWLFTLIVTLQAICYTAMADGSQDWEFDNWDQYTHDAIAPKAKWLRAWGVPEKHGWSWPQHATKKNCNYAIVSDPTDSDSPKVLRVTYPGGSRNPQYYPQGGIGFYAQPIEIDDTVQTVSLEYKVYFSKKFNFMKGGKLPGIFGGNGQCSGGTNSKTCFSTRFMWRRGGAGEVYSYIPESKQRPGLCEEEGNICDPHYGYSLGRGNWKFKTGVWTTVRQSIKLNTPGELDGHINVDINGERVYSEKKMAFRESRTGQNMGIVFQSFFGGSDESWESPKTQHTYYKGFIFETST
ncbi:hypothetical protein CLU79DRAFT_784298 [Phycomyces nitens]|nr:hypothetical protein CLU79DRAFT_784298 [Phycomyces nitens]